MSKLSFTALCTATVIAVVLAIFAIGSQPRLEATDKRGELLFPTLRTDVEQIKSLVIRTGDQTVSLDRDGTAWTVRERHGYPADAGKIVGLLVSMTQMAKLEGKTKLPERYDRLEVEDPAGKDARSRQITLLGADGKTIASLIAGKRHTELGGTEGGIYVRVGDDPQVWLVTGDVPGEAKAGDWLKKEIVDVKDIAVNRMVVTHPSGEKIVIARDGAALNIENAPKGAAQSPDAGGEYARILTGMMLEDVAPVAEINFAKDKTTTAVVDGVGGFQVTLEATEINGQNWIRIKGTPPAADQAPPPAGAAVTDLRTDWRKLITDLNARAEGWAFAVPAYQVSALRQRMADLTQKPAMTPRSGVPPMLNFPAQ